MNRLATNFSPVAFLLVISMIGLAAAEDHPKVLFDIPAKVECQDVTPEKCRLAHPTLKVIEARFRISAGFIEGNESATSDFVYIITSPDMRLKVLSFLPDTTLESVTAEDRIEVTDNTESTDSGTGEVKVSYSLLSIGGSRNTSNKKSESNHYQKVAAKNLVLASGTVHRGAGVFYKLRPSNGASLEGAKEFVLLCIVPRDWRGDWCSVICSARSNKKSALSSSIGIAGIEHAHTGLYLAGDEEASRLSDQLTQVQTAHGGLLAKYLAKEAQHTLGDLHAGSSTTKGTSTDWTPRLVKFKPAAKQTPIEMAKESLATIETRLAALAGKSQLEH